MALLRFRILETPGKPTFDMSTYKHQSCIVSRLLVKKEFRYKFSLMSDYTKQNIVLGRVRLSPVSTRNLEM